MLVDFHTHIHSYKNLDLVSKEILDNNIITIAASVNIESYMITKQVAANNKYIIPTFGIHPMCCDEITEISIVDEYLNDSKIIGEIGLDTYWVKNISLKKQEYIFEYILEHCNKKKKYCVIHTKGQEKRIFNILNNFSSLKTIIHWFDGSLDVYKKMINKNYYSTFGCELYYSKHIKELLQNTPDELILSETDNPESEKWLGGSTDSPLLIKRVVEDISKIKGKKMNEIIYKNSKKILYESNIENYF